jgi:hypothetical protein
MEKKQQKSVQSKKDKHHAHIENQHHRKADEEYNIR